MKKLAKALKETWGVELEPTDEVRFEQNYSACYIADVFVKDKNGEEYLFDAYDASRGCFPYI